MIVRELIQHIDTFAPFSLAEEWDNPGLMAGSYDAEISRIAVCLDAVSEAVIEAGNMGCNVLVCHHPLIFRPLKRIDTGTDIGRTIHEAITRNVNIIAAHTNWDKAPGGVNDTLAALLGLEGVSSLGEFGVVGEVHAEDTRKFLERVKTSWELSRLDFFTRNMPERISRIALCGGSGAEFWSDAIRHNADVYITADMKYHELTDATRAGLSVALAEHGEMERATIPELARKISESGIETRIIDVRALTKPVRI